MEKQTEVPETSDPTPTPDTTHLAAQVKSPKKSRKKLILGVIALILLIAAVIGGYLVYKVKVLDPDDAKQTAAKVSSSPKPLSEEEKISQSLVDNLKKQTDALKQTDDTQYIKNSTKAADAVGRNLNEQDLKE